jgi:hypothetical protein
MAHIRSETEYRRAARDLFLGLGVAVTAIGIAFATWVVRAMPDVLVFIERSGRGTSPGDPFLAGAVVAELVTGLLFGGILFVFGGILFVAPSRWRIGLVSWASAIGLVLIALHRSLAGLK